VAGARRTDDLVVSNLPLLIDTALAREPTAFEFFQAVRLLARYQPGRKAVGRFGDPAEEIARFRANPDPSFPASELQAIELGEDGPPRLTVNVMGLNGPLGTLPLHYSYLVTSRMREGDRALRGFLDLFNHRMISLFYRAWEKHRFTVAHESGVDDRFAAHLADLVGMGTARLRERLNLPVEALPSFVGLLAPVQRSAVALEELLSGYFEVPVQVEQFVGGWYPLDDDSRTSIGEEHGFATQLGVGAVVGDEVWDPHARVRVRLGPLPVATYRRFLPGGDAYEPLRALVRFFVDEQLDVEAQLVLAAEDVPGCVLGEDRDTSSRLAWGTWLSTRPRSRDGDETILTL
jgi:type VI secretion system protein ImpH